MAVEPTLEAVSNAVVLPPTAWLPLWSSAQRPLQWSEKGGHTTVWRSEETCKVLAIIQKQRVEGADSFPRDPLEHYSIHFRFQTLVSGLSFQG